MLLSLTTTKKKKKKKFSRAQDYEFKPYFIWYIKLQEEKQSSTILLASLPGFANQTQLQNHANCPHTISVPAGTCQCYASYLPMLGLICLIKGVRNTNWKWGSFNYNEVILGTRCHKTWSDLYRFAPLLHKHRCLHTAGGSDTSYAHCKWSANYY